MAVNDNKELQKLKQKKRVTKSGFTRIENFIKGMDHDLVNAEEVRLRLNKLDELWKSLVDIEIELTVYDENMTEEQIDQEIASYEEKYINLKLLGESVLKERTRPAVTMNNFEQAIGFADNARARTNDTHVRLPKIDLPTFSWAYEDWHPFFDIFNSLIHFNISLNDIKKFHYLKSSLKGDAAETIASLEISDVNYADAWSRLRERYDNERLAVQNHIKAIFELPALRKESSVALRNILDGILKHTRALQALKRPTMHWDDLLVHIITSKLDFITIKEWENSLDARQLPTFQELNEFLTRRCQMLEAVARRSHSTILSNNSCPSGFVKTTSHAVLTNVKCSQCKGDHQIYQCKAFLNLSVAERLNKIKLMNLCLNCLKSKHRAKDCTYSEKEEFKSRDVIPESDTNKTTNAICTYAHSVKIAKASQVLLSTAIVRVKTHKGSYIDGRALLDSGSQSSFVTEEFSKRLNLKTMSNQIEVKGINQHVSHAMKSVNLNLTSRFGTFGMELQCIILPEITQNLPTVDIGTANLNIPKNIKLADSQFNVSGRINILIGAERFWELICVGQIKLGKNQPVLQKSLLGWVISGMVSVSNSPQRLQTSCHLSLTEDLNQLVRQFWEIEDCTSTKTTTLKLLPEDEYCERFFKENYERQPEGRFIVKLPVKEEVLKSLDSSRDVALKRLHSLERKFVKNPELKSEYVKFMREYISLKHMKRVTKVDGNKKRIFLPHHAVIKESSTTTKTRVVFDASSKDTKEKSLNDALYKGPVIQSDLFSIIIRFRCFKYVLCADIAKMYRQILIDKDQTSLQTILWREDMVQEVEEFELLTVTYGTKLASFLAVRCLQQLAEIEKENFPKAAKIVFRDFYMDDLLTGGNTTSEIIELKNQLTELLAKGGFDLHKWNTSISHSLDDMHTNDKSVDINKELESKLLGILWNPYKDTFHYEVSLRENESRVTKRSVLSQVCKLFDPLGLVGPVVTSAKILVQTLWGLGIDWDESVPMSIHRAWYQIKSQLCLLNKLRIPRLIMSDNIGSQIQVHGFCDASEKAYGACVYLREQDAQGKVSVTLICSKSQVAPMKMLSLPRLELCGAVLLVNLMTRVLDSLSVKVHQRFYWTDSKIISMDKFMLSKVASVRRK